MGLALLLCKIRLLFPEDADMVDAQRRNARHDGLGYDIRAVIEPPTPTSKIVASTFMSMKAWKATIVTIRKYIGL